jgi:hypothetical protein
MNILLYIEICEKILHNVCVCVCWYTAIACIWAIVYLFYIVCVCVWNTRFTRTLVRRKISFAEVLRRTPIDIIRDVFAYFLSIDRFDYCLNFVSVSSVKWYWDYNIVTCVVCIITIYHVRSIICYKVVW